MLWLAMAVVLASAISAYFYLRVVAVMYFNPAPDTELRPFRTSLLNVGIARNGHRQHRSRPVL